MPYSKILFLSNNSITDSLRSWISERAELDVCDFPITEESWDYQQYDIIVSYCYRHIIPSVVIEQCPDKFINLHISLLPHNRGSDPNIWSFLNDTPKGVTIHMINEALDQGGIVFQEEVVFLDERITLHDSFVDLHERIQNLFKVNWLKLINGKFLVHAQPVGGSYHSSRELSAIRNTLLGKEGWNLEVGIMCDRYRTILRDSAQ